MMQLHNSFQLHDTATLVERARAINWLFDEVIDKNRALVCRRGELGRELLKAQEAVKSEHGPGHWETWCKENIHRSQGDIRKAMQIAKADDPEAAAAQEREKAREGMARCRHDRANVSAVGPATRPALRLVPRADHVEEAGEQIAAILDALPRDDWARAVAFAMAQAEKAGGRHAVH